MRARLRLCRLAAAGGAIALAAASGAMVLAPQVALASPDPVNTIYVADYAASAIDVFAPGANGNVAPIRRIVGNATGIAGPADVAVDSVGDVYSSNFNNSTITEYAPGASGNAAPILTIGGPHTGLSQNDDMSLAADGTLYVGNFGGGVDVFAPGASGDVAPLRIISGAATGLTVVDGVGADATGTLYADGSAAIQVFAPGANGNVAPIRTISGSNTGLSLPDDVKVGFTGQLFVSDANNSVAVFAPGASGNATPTRRISGSNTGLLTTDDLAVDAVGNTYVSDFSGHVSMFNSSANGNVAPNTTISGPNTTLVQPEGVDLGKPPAPSLTTTTPSTISLGASSTDTATLSGGSNPTGSLIFKLFGPGDTTCSNAPAFTSPLVTVSGNGSYSSAFTPLAAGTYDWVVAYSGDANNAPVTDPCGDTAEMFTVTAEQPITASGQSVTATEGANFSGQVASFTDPNTSATAAEYSATIDWGDGGTSAGTITGGGGTFAVSGSHTYAEEGTEHITVTITDVDKAGNTATASSTANVTDAGLTASPACSATSTLLYNGPTATFTDAASPSGTRSDFTAGIDWGDGTPVTVGTVIGPDGGPYMVSGVHTYATTGVFTITTTINDVGGRSATTSCSTLGFAFAPGGGSFVIGDQNAAVGTPVTFWGAQWSKDNPTSGGSAPKSFKGFAENPTTPNCGIAWTTDPGNSTPPPEGPLPTYMAVIVTSSAGKDGSEISGTTVHIVIVKTNPGYAANPGHAGTGTVVAVVC